MFRGRRFIVAAIIGILLLSSFGGAQRRSFQSGYYQGVIAGQQQALEAAPINEGGSVQSNAPAAAPAAPAAQFDRHHGHHHYGFGFGFLAFLGMLIKFWFFFMLFGFIMKMFGFGRWRRWAHHGPGGWHHGPRKGRGRRHPGYGPRGRHSHNNDDQPREKRPEDVEPDISDIV